jgi:hypothetical protein
VTSAQLRGLNPDFASHVESLPLKLEALLAMPPVTPTSLPRGMPSCGIYLLSEPGQHLYVGRSNKLRQRVAAHRRASSTHGMATFAFLLAREATGNLLPTYKKGSLSRDGLMVTESFKDAFDSALLRICGMELRYIEEVDQVRQTLLEVYVAVALGTPYNHFKTH